MGFKKHIITSTIKETAYSKYSTGSANRKHNNTTKQGNTFSIEEEEESLQR